MNSAMTDRNLFLKNRGKMNENLRENSIVTDGFKVQINKAYIVFFFKYFNVVMYFFLWS